MFKNPDVSDEAVFDVEAGAERLLFDTDTEVVATRLTITLEAKNSTGLFAMELYGCAFQLGAEESNVLFISHQINENFINIFASIFTIFL